jgi:carbonic anhydrase/acetyltransferase-like protein (isoleucine patch superfamily)
MIEKRQGMWYFQAMIRDYRGVLPKIHPSVFVDESAQVIGDVEIGQDSSVWFQVVIRGDVHFIRIGKRTNIQDGSLLHVTRVKWPLILGNEITVGHGVTLHGCVVKDRCLIGMRATLLDGVQVGEESMIGAGALVTEDTIIPPRSLAFGSPAKVVRPLTDEEVARVRQSAENYVLLAKDYLTYTKPSVRPKRTGR